MLLPEIKITEGHVGIKITHLDGTKGEIVEFNSSNPLPVKVLFFKDNVLACYKINGHNRNGMRSIFIGHSVKITVEEDLLPEPKLICPVCGVEHDTCSNCGNFYFTAYAQSYLNEDCPFRWANFTTIKKAETAMKNLIKAMEKS